jgi:hypothetical protein
VSQLGANALGEILEPGRVADCYLGLRLDPADDAEAAGVLVVAPTALHSAVPQPDGTVLYELLTGHPNRVPRELVFLADLTVELRAWPTDTWAKVGVDPQAAAGAVVAGWQRGDLPGLRLGALTAEEALALERPAMTYVRGQLGDRLGRQLTRADRRGGIPPADGGPATASRSSGHPQTAAVSTGGHQPSRRNRQAAAVPQSTADMAAVSAGCGSIPCDGPSDGQPPAAGFCGRCGHRGRRQGVHCHRRCGVHGRSAAGDRHVPALLRGLRRCPRWTAAVRPAPGRTPSRTADTAAVSGSADICWGCGPGRRSRRTLTVGRRGPRRGWWTPAACGCPPLQTRRRRQGRADTVATPRWTAGSSTVHRHPRCPTRNGDRKRRHRLAPPWPDREIRSLGRPES